jgi:hypothetical protein
VINIIMWFRDMGCYIFLSSFFGGVLLPIEPFVVCSRSCALGCVRFFCLVVYQRRGSRAGHRETVVISAFLCSSIGLNLIAVQECDFSMSRSLFVGGSRRWQQERTGHTCRPWCKSKKKRRTITPPCRPWRKRSSTMKPVRSSETKPLLYINNEIMEES